MVRRGVVSLYEGFFSGGARILHTQVVLGLHRPEMPHSVVSIANRAKREGIFQPMEQDACYQRLIAAGVPINTLGRVTGSEPDTSPFTKAELAIFARYTAGQRLIAVLKEQPLRLLLAQQAIQVPAVVCLHRSDPEHQGEAIEWLREGVSSGRVAAITQSARSGIQAYADAGIPEKAMHYIPNGVDLDRFRPDAARRETMRKSLAINSTQPVVALAARYDRNMKDIPLFLASVRAYLGTEPAGHVVACGAGMTADNPALQDDINAAFEGGRQLLDRLHLLGIRRDVENVYSAADVVALTSRYGETQPLCLTEGMVSGAVPVTTDVGDSTIIVADGRGLVTSREPAEIAAAWQQAYANRARHLEAINKAREDFGSKAMIAAYGRVFEQYAA